MPSDVSDLLDGDLEDKPNTVPAEFERLVQAHYEEAYRFAYSLTNHHSDACDLTQQAFYLAYTRARQLRDSAKRKQWLFSILYREFLHLRRRALLRQEVNLEASESFLPHIDIDYVGHLDANTVLRTLQRLEEHYRTPLTLFYLNQISYKEIATILKLPAGTVMSRLARGKQQLRDFLRSQPAPPAGTPQPTNPKKGHHG